MSDDKASAFLQAYQRNMQGLVMRLGGGLRIEAGYEAQQEQAIQKSRKARQ